MGDGGRRRVGAPFGSRELPETVLVAVQTCGHVTCALCVLCAVCPAPHTRRMFLPVEMLVITAHWKLSKLYDL